MRTFYGFVPDRRVPAPACLARAQPQRYPEYGEPFTLLRRCLTGE